MNRTMVFVGFALFWCVHVPARAQHPHVEFSSGHRPFDVSCEEWTKQSISQSWYKELSALLPQLQAEWSKEGPLLMAETVAALKVPFRPRELHAFLTLCPIQSMSRPLIINARQFLPGPTNGKPRPIARFSALLFHEMLHTHLSPLYSGNSQLLQKYHNEKPVVRTHLHVFSVMKHVYLKLGREQQLSEIVATESANKDPSYARAWDIVNKVEGHEPFIHELQAK